MHLSVLRIKLREQYAFLQIVSVWGPGKSTLDSDAKILVGASLPI